MKYFRDLANESPLPVVLYNVPGRTGVDMKPETVIQVRQADVRVCAAYNKNACMLEMCESLLL